MIDRRLLRPLAAAFPPPDAASQYGEANAPASIHYPPVIGFTPNSWAYGWSSRRRILLGLAQRGWPALYSSGARSLWDRTCESWRNAPWRHRSKTHGPLLYDEPGKLFARWPTRPLWDRVALASYVRHLTSS